MEEKVNTATQTSANKGDTLRTKSEQPWSIESIGAELTALTDEQIANCGAERPEVEDGAITFGEAPDAMKRFFTLAILYTEGIKTFMQEKEKEIEAIKAAGGDDNEVGHNAAHHISEVERKIKILLDLGWTAVRDTFGWTCENSYGVRKDWKIVEPAPKTKHSFAELLGLGNLFGEPVIGIEIGPDGIKKII